MLSISRKTNEAVHLVDENNNIIATVKIQPQRRSNQINLGIDSDRRLKIVRAEKFDPNEFIFTGN